MLVLTLDPFFNLPLCTAPPKTSFKESFPADDSKASTNVPTHYETCRQAAWSSLHPWQAASAQTLTCCILHGWGKRRLCVAFFWIQVLKCLLNTTHARSRLIRLNTMLFWWTVQQDIWHMQLYSEIISCKHDTAFSCKFCRLLFFCSVVLPVTWFCQLLLFLLPFLVTWYCQLLLFLLPFIFCYLHPAPVWGASSHPLCPRAWGPKLAARVWYVHLPV